MQPPPPKDCRSRFSRFSSSKVGRPLFTHTPSTVSTGTTHLRKQHSTASSSSSVVQAAALRRLTCSRTRSRLCQAPRRVHAEVGAALGCLLTCGGTAHLLAVVQEVRGRGRLNSDGGPHSSSSSKQTRRVRRQACGVAGMALVWRRTCGRSVGWSTARHQPLQMAIARPQVRQCLHGCTTTRITTSWRVRVRVRVRWTRARLPPPLLHARPPCNANPL